MKIICILMITMGIFVLGISCVRYYRFLRNLKLQLQSKRIFESRAYFLCFVLILSFICGYTGETAYIAVSGSVAIQDFLIASILLGGAVFVRAIISLVIRFGNTEQLKHRLEQEELMSKISQSFTSHKNPALVINEALGLSATFMRVDHSFLSKYDGENCVMVCEYEYCGPKAHPFIGETENWSFTQEMEFVKNLNENGYIAVEDIRRYNDANFTAVKGCGLRSFIGIPIEISGEFWGLLGFILYEEPCNWSISSIRVGQLLASIFSGMISRNIFEEKLMKAKELAEQGSQAKSDFLSRMSHEMRTPMTAIIGMTSIGLKSGNIERKNDCFKKIVTASNQLLETINNVLDMSKIEANKLESRFDDFFIMEMLDKVETIVGQGMKNRQQTFELTVANDVPRCIRSDEQHITQVLINLLGNATKFTPEKGFISLFVRNLEQKDGTCNIEFEVRDSGIGIPKEQQAKLFTPFEQADGGISRQYGGTGLGLAISKQIVEMLGGSIRLESMPGKGSSFIFNISASLAKLSYTMNNKETDKRYSSQEIDYNFSRLRVLIAEDVEINREIVESILGDTGIEIDFAVNGKHAFDIFSANPNAYEMIFMDIHMPEVDGFEATKMIRQLDIPKAKSIPIIAMTADVFQEDIEKCIEAGMNAHIGKPLAIDALAEKINAFCA